MLFLSFGWAEVSVFGAGDLKSENPYGLNESEKVIFANKKATLQNAKEIRALKLKIEQLNESFEGLRSVVDSLSEKVGETGQKLYALKSREASAGKDEVALLREELAEQRAQNEKIVKALKKLTRMIDTINADYVSRHDLDTLKKKVNKRSPVKAAERSAAPQKSNKALLRDAIKLYRAKKYAKASEIFEKLAERNYKRATSNYYLGEISYYQKAYSDAIVYYKKSASLYDKASYMPTLLLHTALSFKKLGEMENAQRFFEAIIATYPQSAQAKIAQENL